MLLTSLNISSEKITLYDNVFQHSFISHVSVITAERTCWASSPLPSIFDEGLQLDDQRITTLDDSNQSNAVQVNAMVGPSPALKYTPKPLYHGECYAD